MSQSSSLFLSPTSADLVTTVQQLQTLPAVETQLEDNKTTFERGNWSSEAKHHLLSYFDVQPSCAGVGKLCSVITVHP